ALPMIAAAKARLAIGVLLAISMIAAGTGLLADQTTPSGGNDKNQPNQSAVPPRQAGEENTQLRLDRFGDRLPAGAVARLGTVRFRHGGTCHCVVFSSDGKLLASVACDNVIGIWEAATGRELHRCVGHTSIPGGITFSPDGKTLASTGQYDKTIRIW